MEKIKTVLYIFFVVIIIFPSLSYAKSNIFEININTSDIEIKAQTTIGHLSNPLYIEAGALFIDDEYKIVDISTTIKEQVITPGMQMGLGFNFFGGRTKFHSVHYDLLAIGLSFFGEYDLRETTIDIPVTIKLDASISPNPLSLLDTERFSMFNFSINTHILDDGAVVVGCRHIEGKYEKSSFEEKDSDDSIYFGIQLYF